MYAAERGMPGAAPGMPGAAPGMPGAAPARRVTYAGPMTTPQLPHLPMDGVERVLCVVAHPDDMEYGAVSYTHLDVYKRQG